MATPIPKNRAAFTLDEVLAATGGVLIAPGAGAQVTGVSTDTRTIGEGAAFVALRGEAHDGHDHVEKAARAGARLLVVEREVAAPAGVAVVRVGSTLTALGDLGRAHARKWRALGGERTIVAITGSAGKTTTRVATCAMCERLFPGAVHGASGNLNNRVGVPMVLFGLDAAHRVAVIEMGMNQPGEIAELCRIAEPEIGVVTLVAAAHTERVGSIEGVAEEKGALFRALPEGGVAIGNGDDARVRAQMGRSPAKRRHLYGRAIDADVRIAERAAVGLDRSRVRVERLGRGEVEFVTPLVGEAGALASAAAIAVVELGLGGRVDKEMIEAAMAAADVGAGAGRLVPRLLSNDVAVIDDSYNANPASMCSSIRAASEIARATGRRLVLVLGEMRELGALEGEGHDEVGRAAAASCAAVVVAVGGAARRIAERAAEGGAPSSFSDGVEEAAERARAATAPGDLVLVKGSRSIGTEFIVRALAGDETGRGSA